MIDKNELSCKIQGQRISWWQLVLQVSPIHMYKDHNVGSFVVTGSLPIIQARLDKGPINRQLVEDFKEFKQC